MSARLITDIKETMRDIPTHPASENPSCYPEVRWCAVLGKWHGLSARRSSGWLLDSSSPSYHINNIASDTTGASRRAFGQDRLVGEERADMEVESPLKCGKYRDILKISTFRIYKLVSWVAVMVRWPDGPRSDIADEGADDGLIPVSSHTPKTCISPSVKSLSFTPTYASSSSKRIFP